MRIGSFELSVSIPRDGRSTPLREFGHNGFTYIESREGQKFTLKFKNDRAHRVLVVPSIDGLSVLEGKPATEHSRGYIVPAYSSVEIKGWRTSLEDINDFLFEKKGEGKTYAEGTGNDTANCGVIAVKVFAEKEKPKPITLTKIIREEHHHHHHDYWPIVPRPIYPRPWPDIYWCSTSGLDSGSYSVGDDPGPMIGSSLAPDMGAVRCANNVSGAYHSSDQTLGSTAKYTASLSANEVSTKKLISCQVPSFDMGTGMGQHQKDRVTEENFERGSELSTIQIFYASAQALAEIGIDVNKTVTVNVMPQAFQSGFCAAPAIKR